MEKLRLIFALLIISASIQAQSDTTKFYESKDFGWKWQRMYPSKQLLLPKDTTFSKFGIAEKNGTVWHGNGSYWTALAGGGSGTTPTLDQVATQGNTTGRGLYVNAEDNGFFVTDPSGNPVASLRGNGAEGRVRMNRLSGGSVELAASRATGSRTVQFPDSSGTVVLTQLLADTAAAIRAAVGGNGGDSINLYNSDGVLTDSIRTIDVGKKAIYFDSAGIFGIILREAPYTSYPATGLFSVYGSNVSFSVDNSSGEILLAQNHSSLSTSLFIDQQHRFNLTTDSFKLKSPLPYVAGSGVDTSYQANTNDTSNYQLLAINKYNGVVKKYTGFWPSVSGGTDTCMWKPYALNPDIAYYPKPVLIGKSGSISWLNVTGLGASVSVNPDGYDGAYMGAPFANGYAGIYSMAGDQIIGDYNSATDSYQYGNGILKVNVDTVKIDGKIQIPTGAGAAKVLTSDADGTATWQPASGGSNVGDSLVRAFDSLAAHNTRIGANTVAITARAALSGAAFTGAVGIGTTASASAALEISSTTKGVLLPRMTTSQRDAISSPATGLMVWNTDLLSLDIYSGSSWYSVNETYNDDIQMVRDIGSPIKIGPSFSILSLSTGTAMVSGRSYFGKLEVKFPTTISGTCAWYQTTAGNYVGDNTKYNGIALFQETSAGTVTLIDSTARDTEIWKGTSGTWQTKSLVGGSRTLQPGVYYYFMLYNSSSQTTSPSVGSPSPSAGTGNYLAPLTSSSRRIYGGVITSVSAVPTSQAMSAWNSITTYYGMYFY